MSTVFALESSKAMEMYGSIVENVTTHISNLCVVQSCVWKRQFTLMLAFTPRSKLTRVVPYVYFHWGPFFQGETRLIV